MRRHAHWIGIASLLLLLGLRIGLAQGSEEQRLFPLIRTNPAAGPIALDSGDNSFVSAAPSPGGCVFLAYIDRDNGNRLLIKQDAGDHLIDVPLPPEAQTLARAMPSFAAPGEKQADGALIIIGGRMSLYYTGRAEGDPTGRFQLWRLDIPAPACQT